MNDFIFKLVFFLGNVVVTAVYVHMENYASATIFAFLALLWMGLLIKAYDS